MAKQEDEIRRSHMGFLRRQADKAAGVNNLIDKGVLVVSPLFGPLAVSAAVVNLIMGNTIRDRFIRETHKKPSVKSGVVFDAKNIK